MNLHDKIINIKCVQPDDRSPSYKLAHKLGHMSARKAAAELALKADAEINKLKYALQKITNLNPSEDSDEGYNEWGEADCFNQAQKIANEALK